MKIRFNLVQCTDTKVSQEKEGINDKVSEYVKKSQDTQLTITFWVSELQPLCGHLVTC